MLDTVPPAKSAKKKRAPKPTKAQLREQADDKALAEAKFSDKSRMTIAHAVSIYKARLYKQFWTTVNEEVRKRIDAADNEMRKQNAELRQENITVGQMLRQGAMFSADEYRTILACLHPDNSASSEKRARAFQLFKQKERRLVGQ